MRSRPNVIGAALLVLLLAAPAEAAWNDFLGLKVAFTFSLGCESYDLAATMYHVGRGSVYEANPLLAPYQDSPKKFTASKMGISAVVHWIAYGIRASHPNWAKTLLFSNGALKCYYGAKADYLGRPRER